MIGYLRGQILENAEGKVLLIVGAADAPGAVGYAVTVPQSPSYLSWLPGKSVEVFVYTHVREDSLDLYGFANRMEKELFMTLLSVNGIGPKGAMGILAKVEPAQLIRCILEGDKESLVQIPGIGKKTAERVVMELADPLQKKVDAGHFSELRKAAPPAAKASASTLVGGEPAMLRDAKEALMGLGYREQEAVALLKATMGEDTVPPRRVEDLIKSALQRVN